MWYVGCLDGGVWVWVGRRYRLDWIGFLVYWCYIGFVSVFLDSGDSFCWLGCVMIVCGSVVLSWSGIWFSFWVLFFCDCWNWNFSCGLFVCNWFWCGLFFCLYNLFFLVIWVGNVLLDNYGKYWCVFWVVWYWVGGRDCDVVWWCCWVVVVLDVVGRLGCLVWWLVDCSDWLVNGYCVVVMFCELLWFEVCGCFVMS